jgi:phage baseplate assembly protein W
MRYEVTLNEGVNFAPSSEEEEIIQNVRTILKTRIGTVPFARDLGITWEHLDKPLPVAKSIMQAAIVDAIADFEPRAKVEKVIYKGDGMEGILSPRVIISIGGNNNE